MPNGLTASCPRCGPLEQPGKRGVVRGWSVQATGRLRRWFYSVDGEQLTGDGHALTLTVRELPPTAAEWTATRRAFQMRLWRAGALLFQWLTEWQRRGVPHLHGCVFFPEASTVGLHEIVGHWLEVAAPWGAGESAQHVQHLYGLPGWLQYQAKHSARGVRHYQRANVPEAWQSGTGRLWGTGGQWPVREQLVDVDVQTYVRFRRLLRGWLVSGARDEGDYRRVGYLRRMLADPERSRSAVRAVGEFCPEDVGWRLLQASMLDLQLQDERPHVERRPLPHSGRSGTASGLSA
jgi:hypothetical protein